MVGCRWVFRKKRDASGKVVRYKARVVAKGYAQREGVDYFETYAPVARYDTLRTLIANATQKGRVIHQLDVETAFLNGKLEEEVYMEQPQGFVEPGKEGLVCRLKRSIYGLKQSPRCWNLTLVQHMKKKGFRQSDADPCVFYKGDSVFAVYVDDCVLIAPTMAEMVELKKSLSEGFKIKDLGPLHHLLGIRVVQGKDFTTLDQEVYIGDMLKEYGQENANPVATPADCNVHLETDDGFSQPVDRKAYQSLVGSLLYAAIATRPDIAHAVSTVCKFSSAPTEAHLTAARRILRYLKGTAGLRLRYQRSGSREVVGYSDADWASSVDDRRSTSGVLYMLAGGAITWVSKRQPTVALSTAEAEYTALCAASQEAVWLRRLMGELGFDPAASTDIYGDNQGALAIARNPVGHKRVKHFDIKLHFVREQLERKVINLHYLSTKELPADILTKAVPRDQFQFLRGKLGLIDGN